MNPEINADTPFEVGVQKETVQLYQINPRSNCRKHSEQRFLCRQDQEKWLTDVTEFKYYDGAEVRKIYLSVILDLYDRRIVSYKIGDSNNNLFVFETLDEAVKANPNAHPLFHSAEGFSIQAKSFTANGLPPICGRVCHALADALTTVPWRDFGVFSNPKCIISESLLRVTI